MAAKIPNEIRTLRTQSAEAKLKFLEVFAATFTVHVMQDGEALKKFIEFAKTNPIAHEAMIATTTLVMVVAPEPILNMIDPEKAEPESEPASEPPITRMPEKPFGSN